MQTKLHIAATVAGALSIVPINQALSLEAIKASLGIFLAILLLRATYKFWVYPRFISPLRHLPGPKDHHFLLGQGLNQYRSGDPNEPYLSWMRKWPDANLIRFTSFGNADAVLVTGLEAWRDILTVKPYSFVKPGIFQRLIGPIVGKGLVFAEGEEHKGLRKMLAGPFSLAKLKQLIPVFREKATDLTTYFDKAIQTKDGIVELVSTYAGVTLDVIGSAALGVEFKNLDAPTPFHECYERVFDPPPLGQALLAVNLFVPIRWIPLKENQRFNSDNGEIHRMTLEIVRDRIRELTDQDGKLVHTDRRDILTFMVQETIGAGKRFTDEEYRDNMLNMMAAGHETTASALQWSTYAMMKYPESQTRLRNEILGLLKTNPQPGYIEIESLTYLNNFCREILRVWCPAVQVPREAAEDVVVSNVLVPKGTTLMLLPAVVQRNPQIWGDDAETFNPDRWDTKLPDAHAFAAFFQGARQCIGRVFAMIEFKVTLIEIVSKFQFEAVEGSGVDEEILLVNPSPLLRPSGGLKARVRRL